MTGAPGAAGASSAGLLAAACQLVLRSFRGPTPTENVLRAIRDGSCAGVVLYRYLNVVSPAQVRELTDALQAARPAGSPPLLIATDQEGGQLQAIGEGATAWPGNLALGATRSPELARRAGEAIGRELAAVGVNLDYAPVCDLANDPSNPVIGTRAFGDDPETVAELAAAFIEGLRGAGVAGSAKHFPGHGAARGDSHDGLPVVERSREELRAIELRPFRAAIEAGVAMVMIGHLAVPALEGGARRPATTSASVIRGLLRGPRSDGGLGYGGLVVSDALDMGAIQLRGGLPAIAVAAVEAGIDLLTPGPAHAERPGELDAVPAALAAAAGSGEIGTEALMAAAQRVMALRRWIGERADSARPSLDVLDGPENRALAAEIAARSVTLVRDPRRLLPLKPGTRPVAAIVPRPADLTPADTSSQVRIELAEKLRSLGQEATGLEISMDPPASEVESTAAMARAAVGEAGIAIVATIDARIHPGQRRLVAALAGAGVSVIALALRSPHDASALPNDATVVCGYGIQPPTIEALAQAMCGQIGFTGRLPVSLEGILP